MNAYMLDHLGNKDPHAMTMTVHLSILIQIWKGCVDLMLYASCYFSQLNSFPCTLVQWYSHVGDGPDEDTGMWIVDPAVKANEEPFISILHLDCILHAAHLIGIYGKEPLPRTFIALMHSGLFTSTSTLITMHCILDPDVSSL